jgi:hypothetical protein
MHGDVAQMGERCVRNAQVAGSNPVISTIPPYSMFSSQALIFRLHLQIEPFSLATANAA